MNFWVEIRQTDSLGEIYVVFKNLKYHFRPKFSFELIEASFGSIRSGVGALDSSGLGEQLSQAKRGHTGPRGRHWLIRSQKRNFLKMRPKLQLKNRK